MSTIDSLLVVASSAVTRDIYQQTLHPERAGTTLAIAMLISTLVPGRTIFWSNIFGWSGIAATFCPMMVLSLCWKRPATSG